MSLLSLLTSSLTSQTSLDSVSRKTGVSSVAVKALLAAAVPMLIKALTKNASSKEGAASLLGALSQHTNTNPLENQIDEADEEDGKKIIDHIFGNQTQSLISGLAQQAGVSEGQANSVLDSIAPALLSSLSAVTSGAKPAGQSAGSGLGGLLGGLLGGGNQGSGASSALSGIFGNSLAGAAGSLLGGGSASSGIGGLLSGLLGGRDDNDKDNDGASLLDALLGAR